MTSRRSRGATMVEYVLIIAVTVILIAGAWKVLGGVLTSKVNEAAATIKGE